MVSNRAVGVGVTLVDVTTDDNAKPCVIDRPCAYAIVQAPTALDAAGVNPAEVKVATVGAPATVLSHANCVLLGQSLMEANFEGIVIPCSNTNQLRFASAVASTAVKVIAVI